MEETPPLKKAENQETDEDTATNTNIATTNGEKAVKKVVKTHTIDMPTFALAGIVENKPRELEGWFTNKLFQLKKLSSELTLIVIALIISIYCIVNNSTVVIKIK